jgi:uncharacterized protein
MANPRLYYVLFCVTKYKSVAEVQTNDPQTLASHMARSRKLHAGGKVLMAGALLDNRDSTMTTMGVFASRVDAEEYAKGDPFVLDGSVKEWYIREWANALG